MRKLLVLLLVLVLAGSSSAAMIIETTKQRVIPSDPKLPAYDNPFEIDIDGPLHISFKGVFRGIDNNKDFTAFIFVATPQNDMRLWLDRRDVFDGRGTRFNNWDNTYIGRERTRDREIIGSIPMIITCWLRMPASESGEFSTIARAEFCFNGKWYQFRNIKVEEWPVWQNIAQELGL